MSEPPGENNPRKISLCFIRKSKSREVQLPKHLRAPRIVGDEECTVAPNAVYSSYEHEEERGIELSWPMSLHFPSLISRAAMYSFMHSIIELFRGA